MFSMSWNGNPIRSNANDQFNALGGLGGGGQVDATVADNAMVALYSTFASVSFFAGTVNNYLGTPRTLSLGGIGYALYTASFLSYNHNQNHGFVIASGAILGVCASLLWTAQGTVMMSYPTESEKGRYIGYFWAIFNLGAVIGSAIPIGQNWNSTEGSVNDGTYIAFFVLMVCGFILAFFLAPPHKIIRNDLTRVEQIRHPSAW
jgi:sugar phosphate permease